MRTLSALRRELLALGHDVAVANSRGPGTLSELASETGARAVQASETARGADLLIVTIPEKAVPDLPEGILDGADADLVVVDTGNYYPRQRDGLTAVRIAKPFARASRSVSPTDPISGSVKVTRGTAR